MLIHQGIVRKYMVFLHCGVLLSFQKDKLHAAIEKWKLLETILVSKKNHTHHVQTLEFLTLPRLKYNIPKNTKDAVI